MSNLTNNRGTTPPSALNDAWNRIRLAYQYLIPDSVNTADGVFDNSGILITEVTLEENDPEASEVIGLSDIPRAFQNKILRLYAFLIDEELDVYDYIDDIGTGIVIEPLEEEDLFGYIELDANWTNELITDVINENLAYVDRINDFFHTDWRDFGNNGGYMTFPNYIENNTFDNYGFLQSINMPPYNLANTTDQKVSLLNPVASASLARQLNTGSTRLLIGSNDENFIDINLNNSSNNQFLSRQKQISKTKPIQTISVQNNKSIYENSFLQLETGDTVPISLLPQTTLQRTLSIVTEQPVINLMNDKVVLQKNGVVNYDASGDEAVVTYKRIIANQSGQGWFSNGFLGTETFEDKGYDSWFSGTSAVLTIMDLGTDLDSLDEYGNTVEDWFLNDPKEISDEYNWKDFPEGVSPKNPNCSGSGSGDTNTVTLDISDQANGARTTFTVESYESGTLKVYWNGQRQSDQTITELKSTTFSTSFVPQVGHVLLVDYTPF